MDATEKVLVIGGSSGMGLEVARRTLDEGASVVISGRSEERLGRARAELGSPDRLEAIAADIGDHSSLHRLFERAGSLSHLVVTAADLPYGPVRTLTEDEVLRALRSKILGPLLAAQEAAARMPAGATITFTSGVAAYRPIPGGALGATVNGALESLVRALALELAPIRVNVVSPGWVDTPIWEGLATPEAKRARFAEMAARLPAGRLGRVDEVADAVLFLIRNGFVTGTVLHAEGGQVLV